uniref:Putative transmembrane protein n=1 Tax=Spiroplasma citri TaxID=2133 RepID=Q3ZVK3_SPICI|nr:hypothetical protein [Spiroplasma citri]CAI94312.1 putative transmembrane protein [Spiroplasma citri]
MGTLLSILGSLAFASSGAGTTVSATTNNVISEMITSMPVDIELSNEIWDFSIWEIIFHEGENIPFEIFSNVTFSEISWDWIPSTSELSSLSAIEDGVLAGSLGMAAETLGISLAIGAAIYGGYYTYQHWDSVKQSASETLKAAKHYISSATNYLKSWLSFYSL